MVVNAPVNEAAAETASDPVIFAAVAAVGIVVAPGELPDVLLPHAEAANTNKTVTNAAWERDTRDIATVEMFIGDPRDVRPP